MENPAAVIRHHLNMVNNPETFITSGLGFKKHGIVKANASSGLKDTADRDLALHHNRKFIKALAANKGQVTEEQLFDTMLDALV